MSQAWASGSTRAWRRLRTVILERDGHRCQVKVLRTTPLGTSEYLPCNAPARTVGHLDPLCEGHPKLASVDRLRAECERHNYSAGAKLGNARRPRRTPRWSW